MYCCIELSFKSLHTNAFARIPEMAGGWGNPLMQNEVEFMILDGASVLRYFFNSAGANHNLA
jgi:hypothetical protein